MMTDTVTAPSRGAAAGPLPLDVARIRKDFPILTRRVHGQRLVYLDNAATTQKPRAVLDALTEFYTHHNANIHRGLHTLAEEATALYELTRQRVARFVNAADEREIVFTRNATEAINLVSIAWGWRNLKYGDEILVTEMEHHSNLVPWIIAARQTGAVIRHIPITDDGHPRIDLLPELIGPKTKIVAVTHTSNVLGIINPLTEIVEQARDNGALVLVDAAQGAPHHGLDVQAIDADFVAFSSHKMLGPTGVGVLYGKLARLDAMEPFMGGGEMISRVRLDSASWNEVPHKFEAGTPNIADVPAFGAALEYLDGIGMERVRAHEIALTEYAMQRMRDLGGLTIFGPANPRERAGVIAFVDHDIHPHDLSQLLDRDGIAIRAGHHCAQPLMKRLGQVATARLSFYVYNDRADVDAFIDSLQRARGFFGHG